jgi:uncharacterized protein with GYD domain
MAKFLAKFTYTQQGMQGLLKEGGTKRREATEQLIKSLGGKVESYYFTFGDADGFVIIDGPDNIGAAAASMVVKASGAVSVSITVLLTPEEIDKAAQAGAKYRPPGQ